MYIIYNTNYIECISKIVLIPNLNEINSIISILDNSVTYNYLT